MHSAAYRKCVSLIGLQSENLLCLWAISLTQQEICLKMAQGKDQSFASRLFHRCRKSSQEQKVQESEVPHISEFAIMWDKFSKCVLLRLRSLCRMPSAALELGRVSACVCTFCVRNWFRRSFNRSGFSRLLSNDSIDGFWGSATLWGFHEFVSSTVACIISVLRHFLCLLFFKCEMWFMCALHNVFSTTVVLSLSQIRVV